jgi:hypothetical protein
MICTLLVRVTMQLPTLLTSVVVAHWRFGVAHNQLVSIRIGLNTPTTQASRINEKPDCGAIARAKEEG